MRPKSTETPRERIKPVKPAVPESPKKKRIPKERIRGPASESPGRPW